MEKFEKSGKITTSDMPPPLEPEIFVAGSADTAATLKPSRSISRSTTACWIHIPPWECTLPGPIWTKTPAHLPGHRSSCKISKAIAEALGRDIARHETLEPSGLPTAATISAGHKGISRFSLSRFRPNSFVPLHLHALSSKYRLNAPT